MKINKTIFFAIAITPCIVFFSKCSFDKITEVRILYTPIATYSAVPVHCDLFEFAFDKIMKDHVVSDEEFLKKINLEIQTLTIVQDTLIIDVRIKCFVNYTNRMDTLCITNNDLILFNGSLMNRNEDLVNLIRNEIY
jgi:hypothetical protein